MFHRDLIPGALVLKVNYRGSAGYGEKFRQLNVRNLGVGDAWDVLSGVDAEQRDPHGSTTGDADLVGRNPYQAPGVGDQHHVVALTHREGRRDRFAITRCQGDIGNPLPAATAHAIFIG